VLLLTGLGNASLSLQAAETLCSPALYAGLTGSLVNHPDNVSPMVLELCTYILQCLSIRHVTNSTAARRIALAQEFLPRFTCFPASYSSLWQCTHLMDHELIDYQESNPQRVPHIHSQDRDPLSHELY
jgi:hypothetical protein